MLKKDGRGRPVGSKKGFTTLLISVTDGEKAIIKMKHDNFMKDNGVKIPLSQFVRNNLKSIIE
jgi:hypothetical protein